MRTLFDVNVLLALADPKHIHHRIAHEWRHSSAGAGWASCPLTQNGFLRVSSQRSYSNPLRLPDAMAVLQEMVARPDHEFWPDDVSLLELSVIDHGRVLGPRQLTDIYLLALSVRNGGRLVTLDKSVSLAAVRGAKPENLAIII